MFRQLHVLLFVSTSGLLLLSCFLSCILLLAINSLFDVVYTAVADLNGVSIEYLSKLVAWWETVVKIEEFLPMLLPTFLLNGGFSKNVRSVCGPHRKPVQD